MKIHCSAIQYRPPINDKDRAVKELSQLIDAAEHSDIIVLPEMATTGYVWPSRDKISLLAEVSSGSTFEFLSRKAVQTKSWIVYGYAEKHGQSLYNSAVILTPDGKLCANYRKVHLFDTDIIWATPGNSRITIDSAFGNISPGICMDLNDDGFLEYINHSNTAVIPFPTGWLDEGLDVHWYWQNRLCDFSGLFIAANRWGCEHGIPFYGRSAIIHNGTVVAEAPHEGNCVIGAFVDL